MATIGDLVANLTVNSQPFTTGLTAAQGSLGKFSGAFRSGLGAVPSLFGGILGAATPLIAMLGLKESITAAHEQEKAEKKLGATLAATGGAAGLTKEEIVGLAGDLQKTTNFADETTIAAAGLLASFRNISGGTFKNVLKLSQDLAQLRDMPLDSAVIALGKAINNPIAGMGVLKKVGISFTQEQKEQIKNMQLQGNLAGAQAAMISALQGSFGGTAKAMADPLIILKHQVGEIAEGFGGLILPSLQGIASTITGGLLPGVGGVQTFFKQWGATLAGFVSPIFDFMRKQVVTFGFIIENIGPIMQLAFMTGELAAVTAFNVIIHFFTEQLPVLFDWFTSNWVNIWTTASSFVFNVVTNIGENIKNLFTEVFDFIASGGKNPIDFAFTNLLDGAKNTISKLPELPARAIGEMEGQLSNNVNELGKKLGTDLGTTMAIAMGPAVDAAKPKIDAKLGTDLTGTKVKGEAKGAGAALLGSKEALSSIFASMRGDKIQDLIAAATERTAVAAERTADATEAIEVDAGEVVENLMPITRFALLSGRSLDFGKITECKSKLKWIGVNNSKLDSDQMVFQQAVTYGLPIIPYNSFNPYVTSPTQLCRSVSVSQDSNAPTKWMIEAEYSSEPLKGSDENQPENPLDKPAAVTWGSSQYKQAIFRDKNGKALVNSAGDAFDPPHEVDASRWVISIEKNVSGIPPEILDYADAINESGFSVQGVSVAPEVGKLSDIKLGERQTAKISNQQGQQQIIVYYSFSYQIECRREGWKLKILDQGYRSFKITGGAATTTLVNILDGSTPPKQVGKPALLDGAGLLLTNPGPNTAKFLDFEYYQTRDFSILPGLNEAG